MTRMLSVLRERGGGWAFAALLALGVVGGARDALRVAVEKRFTIDEFQYAHAAWLVAQGDRPYVDFFEVHFPLVYQLASLVFAFTGDDPAAILPMRYLMLGLTLAFAAAAYRMNRQHGPVLALAGPLMVLSSLPLLERVTEVRPDAIGFVAFACGVAMLYGTRLPHLRAVVAGLCCGLALWSTQKAIVYASVLPAAFLVDVLRRDPSPERALLGRPWWFAGGLAVIGAFVATYLVASGSVGAFWHWCFVWARWHQQHYKPGSWYNTLEPMLAVVWWQVPLSVVGARDAVRRVRAGLEPYAVPSPDAVLLAAAPLAFASFALQQAPFAYSAIPVLGMLAIFAARGLVVGIHALVTTGTTASSARALGAWALGIGLGFALVRAHGRATYMLESHRFDDSFEAHQKAAARAPQLLPPALEGARLLDVEDVAPVGRPGEKPKAAEILRYPERQNEYQLRLLRKLGELTSTQDVVYDNSGSAVARPHAHFYFYTDQLLRRAEEDRLADELALALVGERAVAVLKDARFAGLPSKIQSFVREHYQPYNGDLWLWGQALVEGGETKFHAIKRGRYFVSPEHAVRGGRIMIDGALLTRPDIELAPGEHSVAYAGDGEAYLLWLPRNGEHWKPLFGAAARFSTIL